MSNWSLVIYAIAALWAVQALLGLMASYRRQKLVQLQQAELARRQAEAHVEQEKAARLPGLKAPSTAKAA